MASITQKTINYLGGVSKQPDVQMVPGQVRDAINAYPDPTFGLIKRPGTKYITTIGTGTQFHTGRWFDIVRDGKEGYVGCIVNGELKIWNIDTGAACSVTYEGSSQSYLTGTYKNFDILSVQDTSVITNKAKVVAALPDNYPTPPTTKGQVKEATVVISQAQYSIRYELKINGTDVALPGLQPTRWGEKGPADGEDPATYFKAFISIEEILKVYETAIKGALPSATVTRLTNTIEVKSNDFFTIEAKAGQSNLDARIITDRADNISQVPADSVNGRVILVANTANSDKDDYYVKFVADNGVSGKGHWLETLKPGASPGVKADTMPHQLLNTAVNTFKFGPIDWEPRLVGDDETNKHPSFIGSTIQQAFFYSNRLGFLSDDNVIFSTAGEYFNFYHATALTQTAADPIDVSVSSIKPGVLHGVMPVAQGLALFSDRQQFLLQGIQGVISPSTTTIKTISNYEMDDYVDPVDMGSEIIFISKTPSYTRVLNMVTKGQDENPMVQDIGRIVADWIPKDVDQLISSPQNEFFVIASRDSRDMYLFRSYREGEEKLYSAWVRWKLAGNIKHTFISKDNMYFVLHKDDQYMLCKGDLNQSTTENIIVTSAGVKVDPRLDLWTIVDKTKVVFDSSTRTSKVYVPYKVSLTTKPIVFTAPDTIYRLAGVTQSGYYTEVLSKGSDGTGDYYVVRGNFSEGSRDLFAGYTYDFDVELPTVYYQAENGSDYPASLTIARYKFAVGFSGELNFKVKAMGSSEWLDRQPTQDADYYNADVNPIRNYSMFTLPIHQRSEHHNVRVVSDTPFPTSLIAMTWEGIYSPRYYSRR
jgi:hypothetical protein